MTSAVMGDPEVAQDEAIKLSVPAVASYSRVARLAIAGLGSRIGFSYDEVEDLRIAVGEVCGVLLDGAGGRLTFECRAGADVLEVIATRTPVGEVPVVTDLTTQILDAVVDEVDLDPAAARIRIKKRRHA